MSDFTTPFEGKHEHYTLKRGDDTSWVVRHRNRIAGLLTFLVLGFWALMYMNSPTPVAKNPDMVFMITSGTQLTDYLGQGSYQRAIALAEATHRPLQMTATGWPSAVQISPATARALSGETDHIRVTVQVYPGDRFVIPTNANGSLDFRRAIYTPAKP